MTTPTSTEADAKNRAWRTFVQGLGIDVLAAVLLAILPLIMGTDFAWSRAYWLSIGGLALKTVVQTAVSYVARKVIPPAVSR